MKKSFLVASVVLFLGSMLLSCRTHTPCAGVTSHVGKVKTTSTIRPI